MHGALGPSYFDGYPPLVANVLGLIGLVAFVAAMVALAAGVTWLVVRLSPNPNRKKA